MLQSHLILIRLGEQTVSVAGRLVSILERHLLGRLEYALIGSLPAHLVRLEMVGAARIEDARLGVIVERAVHIAEIIVERREDIQHSLVRQESVGVVCSDVLATYLTDKGERFRRAVVKRHVRKRRVRRQVRSAPPMALAYQRTLCLVGMNYDWHIRFFFLMVRNRHRSVRHRRAGRHHLYAPMCRFREQTIRRRSLRCRIAARNSGLSRRHVPADGLA